MGDAPDPDKIRDLEKRLAEAQKRHEPENPHHKAHTQAGVAWRMIIELVTGMGLGVGIGYGLDYVFSTLPIFLVIFSLLGFAAGVRVMIQTARDFQAERRDE